MKNARGWATAAVAMAGLHGGVVFAAGDLSLGQVFTDHAVLQRDRPISIWGEAPAGDTVTVTLANVRASAQADPQGQWRVTLPAMPAGGPHVLAARAGEREQRASDVLIGDVWLCSGQSNMAWSVRASLNGRAEAAASADNRLRQLTVPMVSATAPRATFDKALEWKVAGPDTTGDFSATC